MPQHSKKGVHVFIWIENYYQDMWTKRLHILQCLTRLTSKFKLTDIEQFISFEVKLLAENNNLLNYTDFNKIIGKNTYASDLQLRSVIIQEGKKIDFTLENLPDLKRSI